mmetsp:Transcript_1642/g.3045  ORF Transcript_1642/g.3045 Transcript_1642/m.3045 type:complete len:365 (+) Transcript_1642:499-1593(+)
MDVVRDGAHVRVRVHVVLGDLHTGLGSELRSSTLAQVHVRHACVRTLGPGVCRRLRVQVEPDVAQLINPSEQVAVRICIASTFAAAHGDAHDAAKAIQLCHCGKCRHFTIVDHLERHITCHLMCNPPENIHDLGLVDIRWHIGEDVAPRRTVVSTHGAGSTASDRINLGERRLCQEECIHNRLEVVIRVWICDIPLCLLGIEDLVVLHGHGLDVALPQVECQTAAAGILAANLRCVLGLREVLRLFDNRHLEGLVWSATDIGHGGDFKFICTTHREHLLEHLAQLGWAAQHQGSGTAHPHHFLDQDSCQVARSPGLLGAVGENWQGVATTSVSPRQSPLKLVLAVLGFLQVLLLGEHHGAEPRI